MTYPMRSVLFAALALCPALALAEDRLECVMPDGGRVLMEGSCNQLYSDSPATCDTAYRTRYVPVGGSASLDLGITSMRRTEDSGTPAEMCANFYVLGQSAYLGTAADGKYRILLSPAKYVTLQARPEYDKAVQEQANRDDARRNLSYPGFTRLGVLGQAIIIEHAMTGWNQGHYADASFYRQPLSHVSQTQSLDDGKTWSAPLVTTEARLFTLGRSVLDQPATSRPGAVHVEAPGREGAAARAKAALLTLRCVLPDGAVFVLSGYAEDDRAQGARVETIAYLSRPGAAPVSVEPELAMVMMIPAGRGAARDQACQGAGLANGVPYFGASLLDADGKRFSQFSYPDKVWFPRTFNASVQAQLERQELSFSLAVGVTRKGAVLALEFPLIRMDQACMPQRGQEAMPSCPVRAVLRSQSHDNGQTWSDLALAPSSWIFTPGKAPGARAGAARAQDTPGSP